MKRKATKTKKAAKVVRPIVSRDGAWIVIWRPRKEGDMPRGWYIREYHSVPAMDWHLDHIINNAKPPKHLKKGWTWESSYHEQGPLTWQQILEEVFKMDFFRGSSSPTWSSKETAISRRRNNTDYRGHRGRPMKKEDKRIAEEMVAADMNRLTQFLRGLGEQVPMVAYDEKGLDPLPYDSADGDGVIVNLQIGARGSLSKERARQSAQAWRETALRYPKAYFIIALLGYDEDPREVWEIPEAARYVRWWAQYTGIADNIDSGHHFLGPTGVAFLAGCGVYGDDLKREALSNHVPTPEH